MSAINDFNGFALKNPEDFQHKTEVKDLILDIGAENLGLEKVFNMVYMPAYRNFDAAYNKVVKSEHTEPIWAWDTKRDNIIIAINSILNANLRSISEEKQTVAKRLIIKFKSSGNLLEMSLNGETGALTNLLNDFVPESKYFADAKFLGIDNWLDDLATANNEVKRLMKERFGETADKFGMPVKEARRKINDGYKMTCNQAEILIATEGIEKYARFVNMLNAINAKFGARSSSAKPETPVEPTEPEVDYPDAKEWEEDLPFQGVENGDIYYILVDGKKVFYKLIDKQKFFWHPESERAAGGWEKLN